MADDLELLDVGLHGALRLGDALDAPLPGLVQVVAEEFAAAAALCPVMLTKNPGTGAFYAAALLGLNPKQGALLSREELADTFRPLDLERRGFHLVEDRIALNPGDPRFVDREGAALFDADGQPSQALRRMTAVIDRLRIGLAQTDAFIAAMLDKRLIEPIDIELSFDDGEKLTLAGLYTISLDALSDLSDEEVVALFRAGHLALAYSLAGSVRQFARLSHRRNARLVEPA